MNSSDIPYDIHSAFCEPSRLHWLGCDSLGADLATVIAYGAWTSIQTAFFVAIFSTLLGGIVGLISGYAAQGKFSIFDRGIQSLVDSLLAFPGLLLAILFLTWMPQTSFSITLTLCLLNWTATSRIVRAETREVLNQDFIAAGRAIGVSQASILLKHVTPHILPVLFVQFVFVAGYAILGEASLHYLGLGIDQSSVSASWGRLIADGREYLIEYPRLSLVPGFILILFLALIFFIGERLRVALDPHRLKEL